MDFAAREDDEVLQQRRVIARGLEPQRAPRDQGIRRAKTDLREGEPGAPVEPDHDVGGLVRDYESVVADLSHESCVRAGRIHPRRLHHDGSIVERDRDGAAGRLFLDLSDPGHEPCAQYLQFRPLNAGIVLPQEQAVDLRVVEPEDLDTDPRRRQPGNPVVLSHEGAVRLRIRIPVRRQTHRPWPSGRSLGNQVRTNAARKGGVNPGTQAFQQIEDRLLRLDGALDLWIPPGLRSAAGHGSRLASTAVRGLRGCRKVPTAGCKEHDDGCLASERWSFQVNLLWSAYPTLVNPSSVVPGEYIEFRFVREKSLTAAIVDRATRRFEKNPPHE